MLCMPCKFNYYNKLGDAVAHGRGGVDEVTPPPLRRFKLGMKQKAWLNTVKKSSLHLFSLITSDKNQPQFNLHFP